ncbi:hypothetical protein DFH29DRAFT_1005038 [Suillus ampliporus]|nr:hypothetical protein DFH29DRAFT_1005038 [Suillus ampliporus]
MYPLQNQFQLSSNGETPPTSPLHSPKSSPLLSKIDYAEAFTRIYCSSPQSSSPPSSLCPSSPPSTHLAASVTSSGHHDSRHTDIGLPMRRREGQCHSRWISQSNYHPYVQKTPPTPQADHKMASVMGRLASSIDSDCDDETVHKIFSQGLQHMSAESIRRVAYYKEAELEYHRHLSMTLVWEVEKFQRLKHFIDGEQQEQEDQTTRAFEEAALFTRMVADRDSEHASQDFEFVTAVQKNEVERVKQLNAELDELNIFLPLDPLASDLDNNHTYSIRDPHDSDHSSVGDRPKDELATESE